MKPFPNPPSLPCPGQYSEDIRNIVDRARIFRQRSFIHHSLRQQGKIRFSDAYVPQPRGTTQIFDQFPNRFSRRQSRLTRIQSSCIEAGCISNKGQPVRRSR